MHRPLFRGAWMSALFIHYEIEPGKLQPHVPFRLDLHEGKAFVSVVAFSQERLRFAFGGRTTNWVGRWFANHEFLNVRTYVRQGDDSGIFFIAEWVPKWVATWLGPPLFGLPYRLGRIDARHGEQEIVGHVTDGVGAYHYSASQNRTLCVSPCRSGSVDEFLLERYVAYTEWHGLRRKFHVAHEPWPQTRLEVTIHEDTLLRRALPWWSEARILFANFSPGVERVTISAPAFVK